MSVSVSLNTPSFIRTKAKDLLNELEYGQTVSSSSANQGSLPVSPPAQVTLTPSHLEHLNTQFEKIPALDVLRFCRFFFPNLYQSTAFGLTGLVTLDMLSRLRDESPSSSPIDLIFLDTLHHFPETYALLDRVRARYSSVRTHIFRPQGASTANEYARLYGEKVWETMPDLYDWIAKVEPLQRAYKELGVAAVLTGRRRSQGGERGKIPVIELDEETGIVKINPLATWSFQQVKAYIEEHNVPYNELLDRGYKSVGDWHSTVPVGDGEDERAGRWKGQSKTECGIHHKLSKYGQSVAQGKIEPNEGLSK